jgi:hypothetical protein
MRTITALKRRLDRILEHVVSSPGPLNIYEGIDFSLLGEAEQRQLRDFLANLKPYAEGCTDVRQLLSKVTNDELADLERWTLLYEQRQQARENANTGN